MCFIPPLVKRPWLFPKKSQLHIVAGEIYIFFLDPPLKPVVYGNGLYKMAQTTHAHTHISNKLPLDSTASVG